MLKEELDGRVFKVSLEDLERPHKRGVSLLVNSANVGPCSEKVHHRDSVSNGCGAHKGRVTLLVRRVHTQTSAARRINELPQPVNADILGAPSHASEIFSQLLPCFS